MMDSSTGLDSSSIQPCFWVSVFVQNAVFLLKLSDVLFHVTTKQNTLF